MDTWQAILTQRAVRRFSDRAMGEDEAGKILEAGRRAPSSRNGQRRSFIVCTDRDHLRELTVVGPYADHLAGAAMAVAFVSPVTDDPEMYGVGADFLDLGQAAQSMMLMATALGIGSVHAAVFDQEAARRLLGYPAEMRCDFLLSFGYPAKAGLLDAPRAEVPRLSLGEVVHPERW
jgi:nitroreductase